MGHIVGRNARSPRADIGFYFPRDGCARARRYRTKRADRIELRGRCFLEIPAGFRAPRDRPKARKRSAYRYGSRELIDDEVDVFQCFSLHRHHFRGGCFPGTHMAAPGKDPGPGSFRT